MVDKTDKTEPKPDDKPADQPPDGAAHQAASPGNGEFSEGWAAGVKKAGADHPADDEPADSTGESSETDPAQSAKGGAETDVTDGGSAQETTPKGAEDGPDKPTSGADAPDEPDYKQMLEESEKRVAKLEHSMKSQMGRFRAELERTKAAAQQAPAQAAAAEPSGGQTDDKAREDELRFPALEEVDPETHDLMVKALKDRDKRIEELENRDAARAEAASNAIQQDELRKVDEAHPGWREAIGFVGTDAVPTAEQIEASTKFLDWLKHEAPHPIQVLSNESDAESLGIVLSSYEKSRAQQAGDKNGNGAASGEGEKPAPSGEQPAEVKKPEDDARRAAQAEGGAGASLGGGRGGVDINAAPGGNTFSDGFRQGVKDAARERGARI